MDGRANVSTFSTRSDINQFDKIRLLLPHLMKEDN